MVAHVLSQAPQAGESARTLGRRPVAATSAAGLLIQPLPLAEPALPPAPPPPPVITEAMVAQRAREAADRGFDEGFDAGVLSVQRSHDDWLAQLHNALNTALEKLDTQLANTDALAVALAAQTLDQVLGCDAAREPLLRAVLAHRLAAVSQASRIRVRLARDDLQAHPQLAEQLTARHGERIELVSDTSLAAGGCLLELALGAVDAGLDIARALVATHFETLAQATP